MGFFIDLLCFICLYDIMRKIIFTKYHALLNDFLIVESKTKLTKVLLSKLAQSICDRRSGVGADGILYLTDSKKADKKFTIVNSDGSFAEKSGNGLRIAGMHLYLRDKRKKKFLFDTGYGLDLVTVQKKIKNGVLLKAELGSPNFLTKEVPVKSKQKYMINAPLKINGLNFPVTCLSVGNPHTVLFVDSFDFDWETLGAAIEFHKAFPERTNVEFVKPVSRKKLLVADWERGAGATGSSGTGAAAAVAAAVTMGIADRNCEVQFSNGSLYIFWNIKTDIIELTGEVQKVVFGEYEL